MATETVSPTDADRLQVLDELCRSIAEGINSARHALRNNAEDANIAYLVADALDRLGWMADQATVVAGNTGVMIAGDADGWMLNGLLASHRTGAHKANQLSTARVGDPDTESMPL